MGFLTESVFKTSDDLDALKKEEGRGEIQRWTLLE
jgi:hypothetical protein